MLNNLKEALTTFVKWFFDLRLSMVDLGIIYLLYKWWEG